MSSDSEKNIKLEADVEQSSTEDNQIHTYLNLQGDRLSFAVALICTIGFLLFGYDQGVMGSLLTLPAFNKVFPEINTANNPGNLTIASKQGVVIGIYEIGCMCGALSVIWLSDPLGRRKLIFWGSIIMIVGAILQTTAFHVVHLAIARVVSGVGNGLITSTVPVYQSECSKVNGRVSRGKVIVFQGAIIAGGIALSYWIDFAFYFTRDIKGHDSVSWRLPIAFQIIFPVLIVPFVMKMPESPRWLMKKGHVEEARRVFSALEGLPANDKFITEQIDEIQKSIDIERAAGGDETFNVKILFTQGPKRHFHRLCLSSWAQLIQQICGINLITYYAGTIFEEYLGLEALDSRILAACNGTEYFLAGLVPILFIDRWGRRPLLLLGSAGQCLCMVVLTISVYYSSEDYGGKHEGAPVVAAIFLFGFNTFFAFAFLSEMWLLPPELSSLEIRAPSSAISTACNWISNFLIVMITPICFQSIGPYTYTIFAAINFLIVPVLYIFYPETKGRTLEEMDLIFNQTPVNKPWRVVHIAKTMPFMHAGLHNDEEHLIITESPSDKPAVDHHENLLTDDKPDIEHK